MSFDSFKEACGIFGVFGDAEAAHLTYLGLHALQHRGQESAGIVASDGGPFKTHRGMGLVADVFDAETLTKLPGDRAIGHVRYSTSGESHIKNAQPFAVETSAGPLAIAHNGNLSNADTLRAAMEADGAIFQTTTDTEVVAHLFARSRAVGVEARIADALSRVEGAYSLLFMTPTQLIGVRDPFGFRPMVLGQRRGIPVLASETCALDLIEAKAEREIMPGEMVVIDTSGVRSLRPFGDPGRSAHCIFELIYFARPDSTVFGRSVYETRHALGRALAREQPAKADVVIPVPDSGVAAAIGFAEESGIPFAFGLIRSHYVGRTFIEPQQSIRHFGVKLKLNAVRGVLEGKRVVVVDDTIVRGTTAPKIVKMLRDAGAREVHMRISSPPTVSPCYYGIDTPREEELIASSKSLDEIARFTTADSLGYLSLEGLHRAAADQGGTFCNACFTRDYLVPVPKRPRIAVAAAAR